MLIKFSNTSKKDIICTIDNQRIFLKEDGGSAYASLMLEKGEHCIEIVQNTFYVTPFCYLNILNPVFFIWQLRFLDHRISSKKRITRTTIQFHVYERKQATIIIDLSKNSESCVETNGIKNSLICEQCQDFLQIQRYKKTHIFSSVFYTLLLNILCIIDSFTNGKYWENIFFCLLISLLSLGNIRRIRKQ